MSRRATALRRGDIILVVETDKIAYDVEAPAPGSCRSAGGRRECRTGRHADRALGCRRHQSLARRAGCGEAAAEPRPPRRSAAVEAAVCSAGARRKRAPTASRTLATPYARRLARQAGIDLRWLDGSGPRGRIKAADVERAIAAEAVRGSAGRRRAVPAEASRRGAFSAGVEIDITALLALNEQINGDLPDLRADLAHFVASGRCESARHLFRTVGHWASRRAVKAGRGRRSLFAAADCRTLRGVIAPDQELCRGIRSLPRRTERSGSNAHWMASSFFRRSAGRLGGLARRSAAMREAFRPDADGRPVRAALVDYRADRSRRPSRSRSRPAPAARASSICSKRRFSFSPAEYGSLHGFPSVR